MKTKKYFVEKKYKTKILTFKFAMFVSGARGQERVSVVRGEALRRVHNPGGVGGRGRGAGDPEGSCNCLGRRSACHSM